jgi:hypothetical protein
MKRVIVFFLMLACAAATAPLSAAVPQTSAISREPLYAGIVERAGRLKTQTEALIPASRPDAAYGADIRALAADIMTAHLDLKARGTDNDLKCILKGVSLDLNLKMDAILAAKNDADLAAALNGMALLLGDAADVIVTPATADSGMDCVIEFGAG